MEMNNIKIAFSVCLFIGVVLPILIILLSPVDKEDFDRYFNSLRSSKNV